VEVFEALADGTRRRIIELLAQQELSAGEVAAHFDCTQPAISHHLKVLREAGLVRNRTDAQRRLYTLEPAGLDTIDDWLSNQRQFWNRQLSRLAAQIHDDLTDQAARPSKRFTPRDTPTKETPTP
jgi:DNA-binding transcriptional ArsR family regulator